jgi:hypothetical protein
LNPPSSPLNRRRFLAGTGASVLAFSVLKPGLATAADANAKIDIGLKLSLTFAFKDLARVHQVEF